MAFAKCRSFCLGLTVLNYKYLNLYGLTLIPKWICDYSHQTVWDEITHLVQISTVLPLKSGNGKVIPSHTFLALRLLIHAGIIIDPCFNGGTESYLRETPRGTMFMCARYPAMYIGHMSSLIYSGFRISSGAPLRRKLRLIYEVVVDLTRGGSTISCWRRLHHKQHFNNSVLS